MYLLRLLVCTFLLRFPVFCELRHSNSEQILNPPTQTDVCTNSLFYYLYVYIIDQARGQDGWILAEFSFCVFMDRAEVEVHKNVKRELGQYPAILTELAWSIKDLLYGIKSAEKNDLRTCLFSSTEKETS